MCNKFHFHPEILKIKAFYIHFSLNGSSGTLLHKALHDFLTLRFLPRMINDPLEIDGSAIRSGGGPAFLTLHRVISSDNLQLTHGTVYGSRDHVKASECVRFEIYNGDAKVLKGVLRKDDEGNWKLDCKRGGLDINSEEYVKKAYVEVAVDVDGKSEFLGNMVEMHRRRRRNRVVSSLEEIPEEREELESDDPCCCHCDCDKELDLKMGGKDCELELEKQIGTEMESVSWAVDAAILVVSLGVGYLVSRASTRKLSRHWR